MQAVLGAARKTVLVPLWVVDSMVVSRQISSCHPKESPTNIYVPAEGAIENLGVKE